MMQVDFAETLANRLEAIQEFIVQQDVASAADRAEQLWSEIQRFGDLVALHPKIGRPAGVLSARSFEGKMRLEHVMRLAADAGLPELREYVLRSHLILYAHSDTLVLVLSIRHQRELRYVPE